MKKQLHVTKLLMFAFIFMIAGVLKAQTSILSWDFESYNVGDSLSHIGWNPYDIQTAVADDPLASGNKVMKNVVHGYNAAPVLMFVLPQGKTLADYDSLTFKGYFEKGDVAYKYIVAEAYQTMPTGHFLDTDTLGSYNRAKGVSTDWENIGLDISNSSTFSDTVYIAFGINCSGEANGDTTTWFTDDVELVAKAPSGILSWDFESYNIGDSLSHIGWNPYDIQTAVVDDPLASGNKVMKNVVHNYNAAPYLMFVLPQGKTLADYDSFTFKGYFQKGDVAYKYIVAQAYQTIPTGHFLDTDTLGSFNRAKGASTGWENIKLDISNTSTFSDTIYIAFGINCAGTANGDTTTWYADDVELKIDTVAVYPGPPLAEGQAKFLGNVKSVYGDKNFANYWNQLTPGNEGKWGSIADSADTSTWNWSGLDALYNYAQEHHIIFKEHCLILGSQQPSWLTGMDRAQQAEEVETWIRKVGERYPNMDFVDVVNEAMPGHSQPFYKNALGDSTTTWGWVIWAFQKARQYMPNSKLLLNDYNIINGYSLTPFIQLVDTLKKRGLIDGMGIQGHQGQWETFDTTTLRKNLDKLAATGVPIYISELDIGPNNIVNDATQLTEYKRIFPMIWKHPAVKGITLWGYKEGEMWRTACYLIRSDGTTRPAFTWLAQYIKDNPTGVTETASALPTKYQLEQNFPNPFNPTTNIRYSLVKTSKVTLKVYDILGRLVQTLVNTVQTPGQYTVSFNAQNLASGVYFYRINAGSFIATKKLMLVK